MFLRIFLLYTLFVFVRSEDYDCDVAGVRGKCMDIRQCTSAREDLKHRIKPKICSFNNTSTIPNVCCLNPVSNDNITSTTTIKPDDAECPPLEERYKPKTKEIQQGHKAWAKCVEYQSTVLLSCREGRWHSRCNTRYHVTEFDNDVNDPYSGSGKSNAVKEFPHMALLGYGDTPEIAEWLCGGSLISDKYILTAAHCTNSRDLGQVTYAALGVLHRTQELSEWDIHRIKTIIKHPDYKAPVFYNDIALLETENVVQFSRRVLPACLHVGDEVPDSKASATGWGLLGHKKKVANFMHYVPLWKVSDANCSLQYGAYKTRRLPNGINTTTQACYGDDGLYVRDTCQGDSGGPLQIVSRDIYCMYLVIGVTSFGRTCGVLGEAAVYTKVAAYIPWIESIVWP